MPHIGDLWGRETYAGFHRGLCWWDSGPEFALDVDYRIWVNGHDCLRKDFSIDRELVVFNE
jgi:hypothetical protein